MPNTPVLTFGDAQAEQYAKDLARVMAKLEKAVVEIVNGAQTARNVFDASVLLNSQPEMVLALQQAGYNELAAKYIADYPELVKTVGALHKTLGLPPPVFSTADKATFQQIANADFRQFAFIGNSAMSELRFGLFSQAVSGQSFAALTQSVKAATVGVDGKGSPLSNHAKTHANTAILSLGGETTIAAAKSIGATRFEVVGPFDTKTRDECVSALADPVRTEEEWKQHSGADGQPYWGGTPGGFNCRHQLVAADITVEEIDVLAAEAVAAGEV